VYWGQIFLQKFVEDPEIDAWLGASWDHLGDLERARASFDRALSLFGENTEIYVDIMAGKVHRELGELNRAHEIWSKALELVDRKLAAYPDNARMRLFQALLYTHLELTEEYRAAEARLKADLRRRGRGDPAFQCIAVIDFARGDVDSATALARLIISGGWCAWMGYRYGPNDQLDVDVNDPKLQAWLRSLGGCLDELRAKY